MVEFALVLTTCSVLGQGQFEFGNRNEESEGNRVPGDFWACLGRADPVLLTVSVAPAFPPAMVGLQGFQIGALCCTPGAGITSQPTGVRVAVGGFARLEARVQRCPVFVQWYRNGQPMPGAMTHIIELTVDGPTQVQAWRSLEPLRLVIWWREAKAQLARLNEASLNHLTA